MGYLKDTLKRLSDEFIIKIQQEISVERLEASRELKNSFKSSTTDIGFEIKSSAKHAKSALVTGSKPAKRGGSGDKVKNIEEWIKNKGIRPITRLKGGAKFRRLNTDKKSAIKGLVYVMTKVISEKGTIKRYNYKGSNIIQNVLKEKQDKWKLEIVEAYRNDVLQDFKTTLKLNNLKLE